MEDDLLKQISPLIEDDAKEFGQRLGISLIDMAKMESDSSQPLSVGILTKFNSSEAKNKAFIVAHSLINMGREDCLAVFF